MKKTSGDARLHWIEETTCLGLEIQGDVFEEFLTSRDSKLLESFLQEKTDGALILYLEEINSNGNSNYAKNQYNNENLYKSKSGTVYKKGVLHACMHHLPQDINEARSIFFVKNINDPVPIPSADIEDIDTFMGSILEYGVMCGSPLQMLGQSITQVHQPLLDIPQNMGRVSDTLKNEFTGSLHRFSGQILHALQQVNGEVRLNIPNIVIDDTKAVLDDEKVLLEIEAAVDEWTPIISQILEKQSKKFPKGKGALAEIEFWRDRCAALSTLYEQLNTPNVKKMIEALEGLDSPNLQAFRAHFNDLIKQYLDAKDNVKFLTTLERHFKNLSHGTLATVLDTLPSMLNALRMVWIISRHYNKDENMVPLMERIGWEIANKVSTVINVRQIFHEPPNEMKKKIYEAQTVLQKWKEVYLDIRQKIEQSGRDQRWEFDRRRLFDHTDYMAERCADLYEVATVIDQFYSILGPELKAVTGDIHKIDEVLKRVQDMLHAIETVAFDIFDKRYQSGWEATMTRFNNNVSLIEDTAKQFIDASFHNLRSAEGAFELLQNFKNIKSRPSIDKLMMDKFADVLKRYKVEVEKVRALFIENEVAPPCSKNLPPVAGAINWSQSLLQKIKKPIVRFQTLKEMMETESGKFVTKEYLKTGRSMREFEQKLFKQWCDNVDQVAMSRLNDFILVENQDTKEISVNFHPDLHAVIRETKYLDKLGYTIPETALNITLQEDKYHKYLEELKALLKTYYGSLAVVTAEEKPLLTNQTQTLKNALRPALDVLNWNSLSIPSFIKKCNQEIAKFQSIVNQIQKNESMIGSVIESIAAARVVCDPVPPQGEDSMDLQEYYEQFEKHRKSVVEELVRKYNTIGPLLGKIEGITDDSTTLRLPKMKSYYKFWERRIFNALNKMVLINLHFFQRIMGLVSSKQSRPITLFKITAALSAPDIVIHPAFTDINKLVGAILKNIVDSTTNFIRWMDGSCIETPPQVVSEDDEPVTFSFHTDISANPQVIKTALIINQSIHRSFSSIGKFLEGWKRYKLLWKLDKEQVLQRFADKKPSVVAYDEKLGLYSKLLREVDTLNMEKDIDFIRVSCVPLVAAVKSEASAWLFALGKQLNDSAKSSLVELNEQLNKILEELQRSPDTMEDLKFMLNVIDQIYSQSVDIEARFLDIEERYRTLHIHHFPVVESEEELLYTVGVGWRHLILRAKMVDESLVSVKAQFTETTKKQVQMFKEKIVKLQRKFKEQGPGAEGSTLEAGVEAVRKFTETLARYNSTREELVLAEKLFNLSITSYPELVEIENEIKGYSQIFQLFSDFQEAQAKWANTLWAELDVSVLTAGVEAFLQRLKRLSKELQLTHPFKILFEKVSSFKDSIPLFADLKNEALRPRHWKTLMDVTGKSFQTNSKTFTLESVFGMELHKYAEKIAEITSGAVKELGIEQGIQTIADTWKNLRFEVVKYLKGTEDRGFILKGIDDVTTLLDDNSMSLQAMSISRYVSAFQQQVQQWEKRLSLIGEVADVWMHVQRKWMYLEIIFIGSGDIRLQLPDEAKRFERIDKTFKKIMSDTAKNTLVLEACQTEGRLELLNSLLSQLEICQKSLSEYLETKRNAFPRFFFISDDELLSILGSTDPTNVQEHMLKLYDNVLALRFGTGRNSQMVTGMTSSEGEYIDFKQPISAEGMVETWMTNVEAEMRRTLRTIAKEAVFYYPKTPRIKWILQYPGMVTLSGSQVWWTWEVEEAFRQVRNGDKYAMKKLSAKLATQLSELVNEVRSDLSSLDRKKVNTLLIVDVHARDIIDRFVRDSILDEREFEWESQLRFYWNRDADVRQCTGSFSYGHEYMGLNGRLVITPLTDRCIMTLTQALSMRLGGAPAGPAGTGKTETVKDLAKALGLLCVVFNCGEGIDYATMGRIFSGLVQCGGWGCFDEFNRIDPEVLSVISAQIKTIQHAMNTGLKRFQFDGKEISLDMKCGIFITMNPGYAGRSELPDNLKSLFRPVVMVAPDLELIAEIMLFSEGFDTAKHLARKMTVLYRLAQEQLSKQHHYDFGLRSLKSVLVMAGTLKRSAPEMSEEMVIMRALRDMNLPKFVFEDVPLFKGLLSDLFPDLAPPRVSYKSFKEAVESELTKKDYIVLPDQVDKIIQLYETMLTRHCVMVVGPTGGGKSVVIETLARAQTALGFPTKLYPINPKAQTVNELYGVLDPNTRDWTDGLLSNTFRDINKPQPADKKDLKYILFDGDVDPVWVENMNTVMDDNKLLTLPNGERIRLQKHCSLLFEVADLQHASLATVSRCGMVYLAPQNLGYKPYFMRWLNMRSNKTEGKILKVLFDKYIPSALEYMLSMILTSDKEITDSRVFECIFIFAMYWSIGAALTEDSRVAFDSFIKMISDWPSIEQRWMPWTALVPRYVPRVNQKFYEIMVPTVDSVRNTWLLNLAIQNHQPILFMGESGTAKTVTIQNYLSGLNSDAWAKLDINFSSRTTSLDLQRTIEYNVERWSKGIYGPSPGKNLVLFIDDVNMPKVDKYSTQQPIALLKLVIERGGFYDRGKELNWKTLRNVQVVAAMGPPGGGRNSVDPRFVSLFNVFNIPFPQQDTLKSIYSSILEFHLEPFSDGIKEQIGSITESTMRLYQSIQSTLPPTPSKFHYIFNMRDLSRVYEGLCQATIDKFDTPDSFIRLWRNECLRVFHDRLISDHDRELVKGIINNIIKEKFTDYADHALVDPILYGDFKNAAQDVEDVRIYEDLRDYDALKPIFEEILLNYNEKNSPPMNLVLFEDALDHLTRIIRIICRPRGHALLVGIGGSGRQSLTRLAAFAAEYSLFEISLTGGYGEPELREDLKKLYNILGIDDKPTVFLFTDNHVVEEGFLELINNMLTTGMVPALFSDDEKEGIINAVRDDVVKARILDTKENCWKFFLDRARDNLSIVLCMSPTGEALRRRCRAFPGLVNNTVIDWFTPWPEQALFAVANVFLAEEDLPEEYRSDLVHHMVSTHLSVSRFSDKFEQLLRRKNHVTPKNFLDYINIYRKLLRENRKRMIDQTKRLDGGLHKLIEASTHLAELNEKLQVQKTHVDEQTLICSNLLSTIGQSKEKVEASQTLATQKERELQELSGQIQVKKADAEASLEAALPVLEAAKHALQNLSKNEVTEIRSFAKPPKAVQVVCECVAIVRNMKDVSWKGAKAMMTSPNFLNELLELNADEITEKQIRAVKDNIKNLGMPPEKMSTISNAGAGLLTWLLAIVNYCSVAKKVVPKRKAVEMAQKQQKQNQKDLENIKAEVQSLTEELGKLSEQYNQGIAQQKELQEQAELMEKRLTAAHKLISGLSTEKIRWTQELEVLAESQKRVVGDSLLCASFLSYCGPFSFEFRHAMVYGEWYEDLIKRSVPVTNPFRLETLLTSEVEISKWASEGLPSDELSVQNGIFTTRSSRWPLCIDPQMQAVNWIKKKESNSKLVVRSFSDADFAKQLELAVAYGVPMLIEGVDEFIDPLLDPVLEKNINILGDKEVDWNDNFRLYLATKLSNPVYPPGYFGKMSIINCNVTQHGLQEQLLNIVVGFERPELEQQREQLVREMSENRTLLKNFEDMLLEELANSSGMMLDNQELISTLEDTKTKSIEIAEKLELAKVTSEEIDKLRDGYQDAAKRGAILFFVLSSLSAMNTMYEHSLAAFTEVFKKALVASAPDPSLSRRLLNIINTLTQNVYDYTCMGLFEKHKLLFSFQMCIQIMRADERNFSLEKSQVKNPFPSWLPDQGWEDLQKLVSFKEPFSDLVNHLTSNEKLWKDWYDLDSLEIVPPPIPGAENWTTFQRLLVLRCFRVDRVYNSVRNFVMENMGERFVQPPVVTYNDIYEKSSPLTPVIFILSPGADPANDVIKLAEKMGFGGTKLKLLALGQNQGPVAAQLLENGVQRGQWIMLQNCHLLTSWLKTLETILDGIKNPHKDFRLWLTTEPTPAFPIGTLQRSLKVVTEPPNGLKLNMRSSFSKITNDVLAQSPHFAFRPLVYVLAFFHAVVQERRKYDKVGWNVPYDFNESDFSVSLKILDTYLTKANQNGDTIIPWGSLRYLIGEVMYGGRVTDSFDRRVLMTYLHEYMGDFLFDTFQPFFFYKDNHVTYSLPKDGPLENYIEMIESLPHVNTPDVFGLHPNAEIGYYTNASKDIWTNLILLQPNMSDTAGGSRRENIIANIANDILQKIPEPFDIPLIQKGIEAMTPTTVVLLQELERWNKLVETIKQTLLLLQKALVGEIGMSTELEELSQSLFVGGIPNVWRKLAPDTQKSLANWLIHFRQRYEQYNNWIKEEPIVMWMSGLHVPEAYLTALVQTACRKNKWPLDKTSLFTKVTTMTNASQIKERPEQGCYISGLYLEGAAWDYKNSILRRQDPKMLVVEFPIIHIIPMEVHKLRLQGTFHTPVYITQERRNKMGSGLVFAADLPTKEHPSHWVLQGVCLTLNVA